MTQNPHEKISLLASTIAINVSVTICQLPIRQFCILFNLKAEACRFVFRMEVKKVCNGFMFSVVLERNFVAYYIITT